MNTQFILFATYFFSFFSNYRVRTKTNEYSNSPTLILVFLRFYSLLWNMSDTNRISPVPGKQLLSSRIPLVSRMYLSIPSWQEGPAGQEALVRSLWIPFFLVTIFKKTLSCIAARQKKIPFSSPSMTKVLLMTFKQRHGNICNDY